MGISYVNIDFSPAGRLGYAGAGEVWALVSEKMKMSLNDNRDSWSFVYLASFPTMPFLAKSVLFSPLFSLLRRPAMPAPSDAVLLLE